MKILSIFGTRPEAIKMAPVIRALEGAAGIHSVVCNTGQHRELLHGIASLFEISAHFDLQVIRNNQSLNRLSSRLVDGLDDVYEQVKPDRVLVHGDTTTAMIAALAAFQRGITVGHVEAGLRSGDMRRPWPEEMNRRVVDVAADYLFAPTIQARANLVKESVHGRIVVTGNTVIDALHFVIARLKSEPLVRNAADKPLEMLNPNKRLVLVTGHRRESFGRGFENICRALTTLAECRNIEIVYPVHLNPNVQGPVRAALGNFSNVFLLPPQDYLTFVRLMQRADVVLTDSGGVQEEAPALGKIVLVMRDVTERPEAVESGWARLVGTDPETIVASVIAVLERESTHARAERGCSPYGDGRASNRIVAALLGMPFEEFSSALSRCKSDAVTKLGAA